MINRDMIGPKFDFEQWKDEFLSCGEGVKLQKSFNVESLVKIMEEFRESQILFGRQIGKTILSKNLFKPMPISQEFRIPEMESYFSRIRYDMAMSVAIPKSKVIGIFIDEWKQSTKKVFGNHFFIGTPVKRRNTINLKQFKKFLKRRV